MRVIPLSPAISPVHVVLVSLLVDQLSSLFLSFLVDQKKFVQSQGIFGQALILLVNQISFWYIKISF